MTQQKSGPAEGRGSGKIPKPGSDPSKAKRLRTRVAARYVSPTLSIRGYVSEVGTDGAVFHSDQADAEGSSGKLFLEIAEEPELSRLDVRVVLRSRTQGELLAMELLFGSPTVKQIDAIVSFCRHDDGRPSVVLIDDDAMVLEATRTFLSRAGYRIVSVRSPFEATARIVEARPIAVFMDFRMPGLDGATIIQFLRKDPATRDLPVYLYSAADAETLREAVRTSGASGYIQKGDGPFHLLDRLERLTNPPLSP